jgi:serine protease Do
MIVSSPVMFRKLFAALVLLTAGFVGGMMLTARLHISNDSLADEVTNTAQAPRPSSSPAPAPSVLPGPPGSGVATSGPDFTHIAGQAVKGVANISSLQVVRTPNSPFAADPFFRYFFGEGDDVFGSRDRRSLSLGSGVIISSDGYVVTNNHVVGEHMQEITVTLPNKRQVRGRLIGTDPGTDIALLRLQVSGLPTVPWGDSAKLQIGEWVLAIGSPFQLSATVTAGIVSATGRTNVGFADYEDFIQTDAAINPGNSGGALINTRGELVGINTGIFSQSGGYQGIGFAVPSQLVRRVVDDLMKYGEVRRGSVDFRVDNMALEEDPTGGAGRGAQISQMYRNSASYEAGLRPGDVITGLNGRPVEDASQFRKLIADLRAGSVATLRVVKNGRTVEVRVPIESSSSTARRRR